MLYGQERTNYPLTLSVDDLGEGFVLTAQVAARIGSMRVCGYMQQALKSLVEALESDAGDSDEQSGGIAGEGAEADAV